MTLRVAWRETLGRLGVRYWMGLAMWCVAVVGVLQTLAWYRYDSDGKRGIVRTGGHSLSSRNIPVCTGYHT
jgi:hypothetical protein